MNANFSNVEELKLLLFFTFVMFSIGTVVDEESGAEIIMPDAGSDIKGTFSLLQPATAEGGAATTGVGQPIRTTGTGAATTGTAATGGPTTGAAAAGAATWPTIFSFI